MRNYRTGFTLTEILVVLAIVGLLCALLFSAFGASREKGRQRVCASNLHQWGVAFALYAQDYDGIEAQQGVPTTHAQLGLPPTTDVGGFVKQYQLSVVQSCPSAHYSSAPDAHHWRKISYILPGFLDDDVFPEYPQLVAALGQNFALVTCEMHNVDTEFDKQPTWATKWVQSVHINQQIQFHNVPARTSASNE